MSLHSLSKSLQQQTQQQKSLKERGKEEEHQQSLEDILPPTEEIERIDELERLTHPSLDEIKIEYLLNYFNQFILPNSQTLQNNQNELLKHIKEILTVIKKEHFKISELKDIDTYKLGEENLLLSNKEYENMTDDSFYDLFNLMDELFTKSIPGYFSLQGNLFYFTKKETNEEENQELLQQPLQQHLQKKQPNEYHSKEFSLDCICTNMETLYDFTNIINLKTNTLYEFKNNIFPGVDFFYFDDEKLIIFEIAPESKTIEEINKASSLFVKNKKLYNGIAFNYLINKLNPEPNVNLPKDFYLIGLSHHDYIIPYERLETLRNFNLKFIGMNMDNIYNTFKDFKDFILNHKLYKSYLTWQLNRDLNTASAMKRPFPQ
ncbi:hypothetical protein ABK040_008091 [Willaertia magna]